MPLRSTRAADPTSNPSSPHARLQLWIDLGLYLLKNPTKFSGDYPFWAFVKSQFEVWE